MNINFATYEYLYSFELEERYILVSGDNYIYNNSNEVAGHTMQCNFCGDITLQPHNFIPNGRGYRCSICSYYTIRPVIINSYSGSYE